MVRRAGAAHLASIGIPQLVGGGAEKITMRIASYLREQNRLSRVYTGSSRGAESFEGYGVARLAGSRALRAAWSFLPLAKKDPARAFLLTLGYMNFAPLLRVRRPSARIVLRIGSILGTEAAYRDRVARLRYLGAIKIACRSADCIIVQGAYMRADLLTLMPWAGSKVCIIHNFIEDELWGYSPYPTPPIAEPYIFIAAGFRPEKAFDILLPALKRVNCRRKLVIAGIGPDDAAFQNLRNSAGLSAEDVRCLGFVASPYHWIAHADLCVLPSRYEGFSNFLLEAGALGKRVVATSCPGGNAEFFEAYKNVIPVPVDDIAALATALEAPRADMDRLEARRRLVTFERETVLAEYMRALFHS